MMIYLKKKLICNDIPRRMFLLLFQIISSNLIIFKLTLLFNLFFKQFYMEDKNKQKEIIDRTKNPNPKLCDKFMISKNKFCKFEKHKASIYCNFHISIYHLKNR
jgi:hypothetical protein